MTAKERAVVGAEFCIHCQEDCLPLPPFDICGFCDRVPKTGEYVTANAREELRRRWRENQRRSREKKREVAA